MITCEVIMILDIGIVTIISFIVDIVGVGVGRFLVYHDGEDLCFESFDYGFIGEDDVNFLHRRYHLCKEYCNFSPLITIRVFKQGLQYQIRLFYS